ncbi:hypothetical protein MnTg02_01945 [bacterium MnTg02]|nr:hypothetical protein MnTg02_01945 [bacterium MnTg02]
MGESSAKSASLIGCHCQAPCVSGVYCQHCLVHASLRGRPCDRCKLPQALVGSDWRASLWRCWQSPLGVKTGPSSLLTDESVDRPRTDENIEKAEIGVLMSAMHLTTDLIGGDSFGLLSAITGHSALLQTHHEKTLGPGPDQRVQVTLPADHL